MTRKNISMSPPPLVGVPTSSAGSNKPMVSNTPAPERHVRAGAELPGSAMTRGRALAAGRRGPCVASARSRARTRRTARRAPAPHVELVGQDEARHAHRVGGSSPNTPAIALTHPGSTIASSSVKATISPRASSRRGCAPSRVRAAARRVAEPGAARADRVRGGAVRWRVVDDEEVETVGRVVDGRERVEARDQLLRAVARADGDGHEREAARRAGAGPRDEVGTASAAGAAAQMVVQQVVEGGGHQLGGDGVLQRARGHAAVPHRHAHAAERDPVQADERAHAAVAVQRCERRQRRGQLDVDEPHRTEPLSHRSPGAWRRPPARPPTSASARARPRPRASAGVEPATANGCISQW